MRIEMRTGLFLNHAPRLSAATGLTVRPVGGKHVIGIGDCHDPGLYGDSVRDQPMRVATSIHPLVVVENAEQLALEMPAALQNRNADLRVRLHDCGLGFRERPVLFENGVRDPELANIVEESGTRQDAELGGGHAKLPSDLDAELGDAPVVTLGLTIFDLDCCHQRGDDLEVELLDVNGDL